MKNMDEECGDDVVDDGDKGCGSAGREEADNGPRFWFTFLVWSLLLPPLGRTVVCRKGGWSVKILRFWLLVFSKLLLVFLFVDSSLSPFPRIFPSIGEEVSQVFSVQEVIAVGSLVVGLMGLPVAG